MVFSEMKKIGLSFLIAITSSITMFIMAQGQTAQTTETGIVCVAAVPKPNADPISLGNPNGGNRSFSYTIQIDTQKVTASTENTMAIEALALKKTHLVKIFRDGKQVSSFRFQFEKEGSDKPCLWYKSLYETWSLWPLKDSNGKFHCK